MAPISLESELIALSNFPRECGYSRFLALDRCVESEALELRLREIVNGT
jgi:hypothetical protein